MSALAIAIYKKADLSWANMKHNLVVGFLLITVGNGIVSYAEKFIPSGVAALICSMMPLNAVMLNIVLNKGEKVNSTIVSGLVLALCGVALIFRDNISDLANPSYFWGMISIYIGTASWAFGSIKNSKKTNVKNPVFNASIQLLFGGILLLILSPLVDDYSGLELWQPDAWGAMLYLIIIGSFLAYNAYMYALKVLPVGLVTTYAYINPLVAVILGFFILGEKLTWFTALAFITIVTGVYLVNKGYRKQKQAISQVETKEQIQLIAEEQVTT